MRYKVYRKTLRSLKEALTMGSNEAQIEFWNGEVGERWAKRNHIMENMLRPITDALFEHAKINATSAADIGCGCGNQTLSLADHLGGKATVTGFDISRPMLELARKQLAEAPRPGVSFVEADVSQYAFPSGAFDLLFSRFGVMFFDDPLTAFINLRSALAEGGTMLFSCWQGAENNPWIKIPMQAALKHVPPPPKPDPHAPGPFAFADSERVTEIFKQAGFANVRFSPHKVSMNFSESHSLAEGVRILAEVGPISGLIAEQEEPVRDLVYRELETVLAPFYKNNTITLEGNTWFVTASAG